MHIRRKGGFTLIEIMIVVAIVALLAAMAIPQMVRARRTSQTNACINNLRQIDNAKEQWALEKGKRTEEPVAAEIRPYLGRGAGDVDNVHCPLTLGGAPFSGYAINPVGTLPACNNFADPTHLASLQ